MVTKTEEKQVTGEEQNQEHAQSAASNPDETEASKVEVAGEQGGDEGKKEEGLKYTEAHLNTEADKRAAKLAQGLKDKEMKSYYDKLNESNATIKRMQEEAETAKSEAALKAQEKAEIEEWGDTAEIKSFQESRRQTTSLKKEVDRAITLYEDNRTKLAEDIKHTNALRVAISAILPDVSDLLGSFVEELEEGSDSPKAMEYLAKIRGGEHKQTLIDLVTGEGKKPGEKKKETTHIDSGSHSAPGGMAFKDLPAEQRVSRSLKKLKEKKE